MLCSLLSRRKRLSRCWKFFCLILGFELTFILVFLVSHSTDRSSSDTQYSSYVQTFERRTWRNQEPINADTRKVILAWTSFWFQGYWCDMSMDKGEPSRCANRCDVTTYKNRLKESDAVVFHLPDVLPWTKMPETRTADQVWVLYNLEPPPRQIWYLGGGKWKNVYNWTLSYRQDATVVVRPYHGYEPLTQAEKIAKNLENKDFMEGKSKMIMAAISDCYDDAGRYKDIYALSKYVDIDIYGHCGTMECPQWKPFCEETIRMYKFQLSLENAYCTDYITEKYWEAHMRKLIPIVNWRTDPAGLVFPHSYINIFDFPDMKSLADYLIKVANNETLYNSYFHWTKEYKMNCHCGCHWCALCDALHDISKPAQVITDPLAWTAQDTCELWSVPNSIGRLVRRWLFNVGLYSYDRW